jgi:hypothetical protein
MRVVARTSHLSGDITMKDSQTLLLQRHLAQGKPITPIGALAKWGCFRLGARIHELRKQRFPIVTTLVKRGRSRFASYRIDRSKS